MPGDHDSMVLEPNVRVLASHLRNVIVTTEAAMGGKGGGGRPDMAQAGGPNGDQAETALAAIKDALAARS